MENSKQRL